MTHAPNEPSYPYCVVRYTMWHGDLYAVTAIEFLHEDELDTEAYGSDYAVVYRGSWDECMSYVNDVTGWRNELY